MKLSFLLFLDFDGVICDSAPECFDSSITAYNSLKPVSGTIRTNVSGQALYDRFCRLRPFIRNSEDYIFLQEIIALDLEIKNQNDFDRFVAVRPPETKKEYKKIFYEVRSSSLARNPERWYSLNPIYPHMIDPLKAYAEKPGLRILSTKRSDFITKIFERTGIRIGPDRILFAGEKEKKLEVVTRFLEEKAGEKATFVDDQADHLKGNTDPRITVCLPLWGYIDKNNLPDGNTIRLIDEAGMAEIFRLLE
jgi:phosphoglycolate phosphatase-like HAD superfamily hydrolase